jgi:hypothetical protein
MAFQILNIIQTIGVNNRVVTEHSVQTAIKDQWNRSTTIKIAAENISFEAVLEYPGVNSETGTKMTKAYTITHCLASRDGLTLFYLVQDENKAPFIYILPYEKDEQDLIQPTSVTLLDGQIEFTYMDTIYIAPVENNPKYLKEFAFFYKISRHPIQFPYPLEPFRFVQQ